MAKELFLFPTFRENLVELGNYLRHLGFKLDVEGKTRFAYFTHNCNANVTIEVLQDTKDKFGICRPILS